MEDALEHLALVVAVVAFLFADPDHQLDLFLAHQRHAVAGLAPHQLDQRVADQRRDHDERLEEEHQKLHEVAQGEDHDFRVVGREDFGCDLGHDQDHRRHGHRRKEHAHLLAEVPDEDRRRNRGDRDVQDVVADDDRRDQLVQAGRQLIHPFGAADLLFPEVREPDLVQGDERGFHARQGCRHKRKGD